MTDFFFHPLCVKTKDNQKVVLGLCSRHSWMLHLVRCHNIHFCIFVQYVNTPKNVVLDFCRTAPIGVSPVARASLAKLFCVLQVFFFFFFYYSVFACPYGFVCFIF